MSSTILNSILSGKNLLALPQKKAEAQTRPDAPKLNYLQKDTVSFGNAQRVEQIAKKVVSSKKQEAVKFKELCARIFLGYKYEVRLKEPESVTNKVIRRAEKDLNEVNAKDVREITTDLGGARVVTDGSEESIKEILERLCKEIEVGNLTITEIRNYHGMMLENAKNSIIQPYMSKETRLLLENAQQKVMEESGKPFSIKFTQGVGKESSGYTALHILAETPKGLKVEIQCRGDQIKHVDNGTHLLHDIDIDKSGKKIAIDSAQKRTHLKPVIEAYKTIPKNSKDKTLAKLRATYNEYIFKCYKAAREAELYTKGIFKFPELPKGIDETLSMENLIRVSEMFNLK